MPVLSFPCALHRFGSGAQPTRPRVWIKGHDLRTLALAAVAQLGVPSEQCQYTIVKPDTAASALLEVTHADGDALVGPMASPIPPLTLSRERGFSLDELLALLGFDEAIDGSARDGALPRRAYFAVVGYSPIWHPQPEAPASQTRQPSVGHKPLIDEAERTRIERCRLQGFHLVNYDVPPEQWTAHNLESLLLLAYRLLPTTEPRWRESGAITQAKFADPRDRKRITLACALQIARGDYVASLRLPHFPATALADWLADRHCDIHLRHPVMKLEAVARGWRRTHRADIGTATSPRAIDALSVSSL